MVFKAKSCQLHCSIDLKEILSKMTDFQRIKPSTFEHILNISHIKEYPKDSILCYKDDVVQSIQYLFHGSIKACKINKYDNEIIVNLYINDCARLNNPPLVNYCALIDTKAHNSLYCLENCRILSIQTESFKELLKDDIELVNNILRRSNEIINEQDYLIDLAVMDSKAKVISLLEKNPDIFSMVNKKTISQLLNISQETLSRILQKIKIE
ncbi:Crp/Fnr family transcriptional regulator [Helicobacter sp. MIT 14-3879]|uniref:Crp/Fnr family transcriptional regulator n=1 Tax=Helicobacter sp. MIT 14-3879 TaxID=2040649 RepID=UPI000E1F721D|nr:Crp/Fnr family transcriptional regulator [Helicobacter sp. MIT 14-3879]RDU63484.1 hypothetical protein CQA44_05180 [Helicobacter sp. MIT 14-3879]